MVLGNSRAIRYSFASMQASAKAATAITIAKKSSKYKVRV